MELLVGSVVLLGVMFLLNYLGVRREFNKSQQLQSILYRDYSATSTKEQSE